MIRGMYSRDTGAHGTLSSFPGIGPVGGQEAREMERGKRFLEEQAMAMRAWSMQANYRSRHSVPSSTKEELQIMDVRILGSVARMGTSVETLTWCRGVLRNQNQEEKALHEHQRV